MTTYIIPKENVRLRHTASTDIARPSMQGVYFDKKRKVAVATDGHIMGIQRTHGDNPPSGHLVKFDKLKKTNGQHYTFSPLKDNTFAETSGAGNATIEPEKHFPDWWNVIPAKREKSFIVTLDAGLLKKLADAIDGDTEQRLTLEFDAANPLAAVVVQGRLGAGIIMPCKTTDDAKQPLKTLKELVKP